MFKLFLPNFSIPVLKCFMQFSSFIQRRSTDYLTWRVARVSPFGLPESLTFVYSFRPKTFLKCLYKERHSNTTAGFKGWYFKCVFWLLKGIKLNILNIRDGVEFESLNCLGVQDYSRLTSVSDRLVTLQLRWCVQARVLFEVFQEPGTKFIYLILPSLKVLTYFFFAFLLTSFLLK